MNKAKWGGVVCVQCVEAHKYLLIKEGAVELEGVEAYKGFQKGKKDELFLGGHTLEVKCIVKNFLIFRNFVDRHDRRD